MLQLSKCSLFVGLSDKTIDESLKNIHHQVRHFHKEDIIAYAGDSCQTLLIVTEGVVAAEMSNFDGRFIRIEELHAPSTLAEAFVFGNQNTFPDNIIALSDCSILGIPKDELLKLFQLHTIVMQNFLNSISIRTQFLTSKIRFLTLKTLKGKLSSYILKIADKNSKQINLPMTQEKLAAFFGVARPSLSRALLELQDEGAIFVNRKEITIVDRSILVGYVDE